MDKEIKIALNKVEYSLKIENKDEIINFSIIGKQDNYTGEYPLKSIVKEFRLSHSLIHSLEEQNEFFEKLIKSKRIILFDRDGKICLKLLNDLKEETVIDLSKVSGQINNENLLCVDDNREKGELEMNLEDLSNNYNSAEIFEETVIKRAEENENKIGKKEEKISNLNQENKVNELGENLEYQKQLNLNENENKGNIEHVNFHNQSSEIQQEIFVNEWKKISNVEVPISPKAEKEGKKEEEISLINNNQIEQSMEIEDEIYFNDLQENNINQNNSHARDKSPQNIQERNNLYSINSYYNNENEFPDNFSNIIQDNNSEGNNELDLYAIRNIISNQEGQSQSDSEEIRNNFSINGNIFPGVP